MLLRVLDAAAWLIEAAMPVFAVLDRLQRGLRRKWPVVTLIGFGWLIVGPLVFIVLGSLSVTFAALALFVGWIWIVRLVLTNIWNASSAASRTAGD